MVVSTGGVKVIKGFELKICYCHFEYPIACFRYVPTEMSEHSN